MPTPDPSVLREALRSAGCAEADAPMSALPDKGLAHLHVSLHGTGRLLRCPKQSQLGLAPAEHLAYEAACFTRAAASGHTPRLHQVLAPTPQLPRGALLVDHIEGRPARLPDDLGAIAATLAALHTLPLPQQRAPLLAPAAPLAALLQEIGIQAVHLDAAGLEPGTRAGIEAEWRQLRDLAAHAEPASALISFDSHPGNYVVRADGRAMLVDLEKARYGPAPLDLAHATLYTSTTWDVASHAELTPAELLCFHQRWLQCMPSGEAQAEWIVPLRHAMWLWSITWCAKWRVLSSRRPGQAGPGSSGRQRADEDWSAELSDPALVAHVRERVDHYLTPAAVERVRQEAETLQRALG